MHSLRGGARLMAFFRFFALILIVLGLMLLGADVVTMLESGQEPVLRTLENVWALFTATGVAPNKNRIGFVLGDTVGTVSVKNMTLTPKTK